MNAPVLHRWAGPARISTLPGPRLVPLHPLFGAEVAGIALAQPLPEPTLAWLREALAHHRLLVFRDQQPAPARQAALLTHLAESRTGSATAALLPEGWHFLRDMAGRPARLAALHAARAGEAAQVSRFADQRAAYDRLDPWLAYHIEWLEAEHGPADASHPLVRLEPGSLRRGLFVDAAARRIAGLSPAESDRLLVRLRTAATNPALVWRHAWRPGDLLVWDSQALLHHAEAAPTGWPWQLHPSLLAGAPPRGPVSVAVPWLIAG